MKWILVLALLSVCVSAATIEGIVYDFELLPVKAVVSIDTVPKQVIVANEGAYSFQVPLGRYVISAESGGQYVEENISVVDDGSYILDLILLPDLELEEALLESAEIDDFPVLEEEDEKISLFWLLPVLLLLVLFVIWFVRKRKTKSLVEDVQLKQVLDFIEKQGCRTTQKDIYRQFPHSESKISLMLDDLESKGLIRKVKKGRGNLIFRK